MKLENIELNYLITKVETQKLLLPFWPSCLDRGALINVDAPGFSKSMVRGPTEHK